MSKKYDYEYFIDGAVFINTEKDSEFDMESACELLNNQDQRIAELEEQLKNSIVLPIKNNKIYYILHSKQEIIEYDICSLKVDSFRTNDYDSWLMSEYGKDWFSTKEEAQAKLKQLKGEKDET